MCRWPEQRPAGEVMVTSCPDVSKAAREDSPTPNFIPRLQDHLANYSPSSAAPEKQPQIDRRYDVGNQRVGDDE